MAAIACYLEKLRSPRVFLCVFIIFCAFMWTLLPSLFYCVLPLDSAEAIMWGSSMEWGNCKHPPLSGFAAYRFSALFDHADFSIYLLSQIFMSLGFIYLYRLGREFFGEAAAVMSALMITFFFFYNWETPKFNANIPHLALWPMAAYYFYRAVRHNRMSDWLLLGLAAGLGMLTKYIEVLLLGGFFCYMLYDRTARKRFAGPGPYAAMLITSAVIYPHLKWLYENAFLPFTYVSEHLARDESYFYNLLRVFAIMMVPFACICAGAAAVRLFSGRKFKIMTMRAAFPEAARFAWFIFGLPMLCVLVMALFGKRIDSMWLYQLFLFSGLLVMSYWPDTVDGLTFAVFRRTVTGFAVAAMLGYTVYSATVSKMRRHLDSDAFAAAALDVWHENDKGLPPLLFGDMWAGAQLQHDIGYEVPVCVEYDYSDIKRLGPLLKKRGALIVSEYPEATAAILQKEFGLSPRWIRRDFDYSAPFGKTGIYTFYFAALKGAE